MDQPDGCLARLWTPLTARASCGRHPDVSGEPVDRQAALHCFRWQPHRNGRLRPAGAPHGLDLERLRDGLGARFLAPASILAETGRLPARPDSAAGDRAAPSQGPGSGRGGRARRDPQTLLAGVRAAARPTRAGRLLGATRQGSRPLHGGRRSPCEQHVRGASAKPHAYRAQSDCLSPGFRHESRSGTSPGPIPFPPRHGSG